MAQTLSHIANGSLKDIVQALDDRTITSTELVAEYLRRIERDNTQGRQLRALMDVAPRVKVIAAAAQLDEERAMGKCRSPLHGVPILVDDMIGTTAKMGMQTTGGANALADSIVDHNAAIVDHFIASGMLIIGKANGTVFGNFWGSDTRWGWSPQGGQVVSAIDPKLEPLGSSTGCAVAISAGFCPVSIGLEIDGGLVAPAMRANLFAMKPSRGSISNKGVMHPERATLGPMGRSVWDVAAVLDQMTEHKTTYVSHVVKSKAHITNYRLGIPRQNFPTNEGLHFRCTQQADVHAEKFMTPSIEKLEADAKDLFEGAVKRLGQAVVADPADIPDVLELFGKTKMGDKARFSPYGPLPYPMRAEYYNSTNDWLSQIKNCKVKSIEELMQWNSENRAQALYPPNGNQEMLEAAVATKGIEDEETRQARAWVEGLSERIDKVFEDNNLDALVFPGSTWGATAVASTRGYPLATVPIGAVSDGTPAALFLMAKMGNEAKLIEIMACCEAIFGVIPIVA